MIKQHISHEAYETYDVMAKLLDFVADECAGCDVWVVIHSMLGATATLMVEHCDRTGEDYGEMVALVRESFKEVTSEECKNAWRRSGLT